MGAVRAYQIHEIIDCANRMVAPYKGVKLPDHDQRFEYRKRMKSHRQS